ncbi:MAG: acyl-CoA dehydrogenase family protein [Nitrososphaerota archaeon]|nr:acyl-CoA dehydrogenase family protein [Nitrososphaerota archaeon]
MRSGDVYAHLSNAYGKNHFEVDRPLQLILQYFVGRVPDLTSLGSFTGRELYEVADYVDKVANPKQVMWSINGERVDEVWLSPSERIALERLFKEFGVNRPPYRGGTWFDHYASIYLISDPGIACILTVTNQTAYALHKYGDEVQRKLIRAMIGEEDAISYGATWFTELQGGSDLGANLVEARQEGSSWRINGDTKYFASNAGLADFALVTARPRGAPPGAKGLGLFLVPKYDSAGRRNFVVRRLKEKSATVSVPTGEVEFPNSEARPVGDLRNGIYYTMEDLMVSRLSNSFGALGIARKAYLEAYYYAKKRRAFGELLIEHPLVQRDLLDMELYLEGSLALAFKAVDQFQKSWALTPPYDDAYHYGRLLTHIAKNTTAEMASYVTKMTMELHGGIGFLEEFPVERLHREALITPIWEGPSNIQALDMLEVIAKKKAHLTLLEDMRRMQKGITSGKDVADGAVERMSEALERLSSSDEAEAQFQAKDALSALGNGIATVMLLEIGTKLGIGRFLTLGRLYAARFLNGGPYPSGIQREAKNVFAIDELPRNAIARA